MECASVHCLCRLVVSSIGTSEDRDCMLNLGLPPLCTKHTCPFLFCDSIQRWCREKDFKWTNEACLAAARSGHLDTLKYLVEEGCNLVGEQLNIYNSAARGGHAHVLRYLSECDVVKFVWDSQKSFQKAVARSFRSVSGKADFLAEVLDICEDAYISVDDLIRFILLGRKHFRLVEKYFVRVKGYPNIDLEELANPSMVVDAAVEMGSIYMVYWLLGKGFPCDDDTVLSCALQFGHLELLTTLISRGVKWTESSDRRGFQVAATENRVDDIETCMAQPGGGTIFENGRGGDLCSKAAESGASRARRFALEQTKGHKDDDICWNAVQTGKLEVVKVAVEGRAPLSSNCADSAVEGWDERILEYLIVSECPIGDDPFDLAANCDHDDMLNTLVSCKVLPVSPALVEGVVASESCELVEWALEVCDIVSDETLFRAAELFDHEPLKLLYTKVHDAQWRKVYPKLLCKAACDDVKGWIKSTKTW